MESHGNPGGSSGNESSREVVVPRDQPPDTVIVADIAADVAAAEATMAS